MLKIAQILVFEMMPSNLYPMVELAGLKMTEQRYNMRSFT